MAHADKYRVYFEPAAAGEPMRADLLPWDLDNGFTEEWLWGRSWTTPWGVVASNCRTDPA